MKVDSGGLIACTYGYRKLMSEIVCSQYTGEEKPRIEEIKFEEVPPKQERIEQAALCIAKEIIQSIGNGKSTLTITNISKWLNQRKLGYVKEEEAAEAARILAKTICIVEYDVPLDQYRFTLGRNHENEILCLVMEYLKCLTPEQLLGVRRRCEVLIEEKKKKR